MIKIKKEDYALLTSDYICINGVVILPIEGTNNKDINDRYINSNFSDDLQKFIDKELKTVCITHEKYNRLDKSEIIYTGAKLELIGLEILTEENEPLVFIQKRFCDMFGKKVHFYQEKNNEKAKIFVTDYSRNIMGVIMPVDTHRKVTLI